MSSTDLIRRAYAAYFRRNGSRATVPSSTDSAVEEVDGKSYVVLRNLSGTLAVYRVKVDGQLKFLVRWPSELDPAKVAGR
jgi:hypothetical protein